jgi:hypothetical protein
MNNNNIHGGLCKSMKDVYKVFDDNLNLIINIIDETSLSNCFRISADLVMFSTMAEFEEGVFISEVLEGVIWDIDSSISGYENDPTEISQLIDEIKNQIGEILNCYKKDENKVNLILKKMRFYATSFSIGCRKTKREKPSENQF